MSDQLEDIVKGCRANDRASQEQLYRHFYPDMIRICLRYAADLDGAGIIFNNAMLRVFKNVAAYEEQGRIGGWIRSIVVNCCLDFARQQHRFDRNLRDSTDVSEVELPAEALDKVSAKEILEMIRKLPKATSTVFNLFIYEGFSHSEIAAALGIAEGTSKWHVNEGRRLLRDRLNHFNHPNDNQHAGK